MKFIVPLAIAALALSTPGASAKDCPVDVTKIGDLSDAEVATLYDCMKGKMQAGYSKAGDETAAEYRNWTVTATQAVVEGNHSGRALLTFANDIAAPQYTAFAEEGFVMPVGSVLAKESLSVHPKNKVGRVGPLFLMTKLEAGGAPETGDWLYGGIQANGKPMKFKQSFCHECHEIWSEQDYLAYPVEEFRVTQ